MAEISDAWLGGRARELMAIVQRSTHDEQLNVIAEVDELLEEAQRRGEPLLIGQILRVCASSRLVTNGQAAEAEPRLDELLAHTRRHGLGPLRADAHALRGRRLMLAHQDDAALTEIATSLAVLDDERAPNQQLGKRLWSRLLSAALNDCWIVLNQLGVYEAAEEVLARAHHVGRDTVSPHEISAQLMNRVKMLLSWGLRLERVGKIDEATERFHTAASMSVAVEEPFSESLFPRLTGVAAVEQVGVLASALALADPGPGHIARLTHLHDENKWPSEKFIVTIALARCLRSDGRPDDAIEVLSNARSTQTEENTQPSMRLNLALELAKFTDERAGNDLPEAGTRALNVLADYVNDLEAELWSLRQTQVATLNTRREHERLSAQHGAITQQAMHDPLTGMPNRRALDDQLREFATSERAQPLAVALVDLDGFKDVNDRHSHAEGDDVLRVVASTLRDTLRGDDVVARYGGDEFIVLLPGAPASSAKQALARAVSAVASLPHHLSHGVTLSVGLVTMRTHEGGEQVLSRADAAMYQAKRRGGNQVSSASPDMPAAPAAPAAPTAAGDVPETGWPQHEPAEATEFAADAGPHPARPSRERR